jgi:hypothetical protein
MSALAARVRAEFFQAPGLLVTPRHAERVFELEPDEAVAVLNLLAETGFLVRDAFGRFGRPASL